MSTTNTILSTLTNSTTTLNVLQSNPLQTKNNFYSLSIPSYIDAYVNTTDDINEIIHNLTTPTSILSLPSQNNLNTSLSNITVNVGLALNKNSFNITNNYIYYQYIGKIDIIQIACGLNHAIFLENTGKVLGCGLNTSFQLGMPQSSFSSYSSNIIPVYIPSLSNIQCSQVACGENHSLFLTSGNVLACGLNTSGQLGQNNITSPITTPAYVYANTNLNILNNIIQIACGQNHSMFLTSNNFVLGCGMNNAGQLGNGTTTNQQIPVNTLYNAATAISNIAKIACGAEHNIFLTLTNSIVACGKNVNGQLGIGNTTTTQLVFAQNISSYIINSATSNTIDINDIACGAEHSILLLQNNTAVSCGTNANNRITPSMATTSIISSFTNVLNLTNITDIAAGANHSIYTVNNNQINLYGLNTSGQLNNSNVISTNIINNLNIRDIFSGPTANYNLVTLDENRPGTIIGWGANPFGQLGTSTLSSYYLNYSNGISQYNTYLFNKINNIQPYSGFQIYSNPTNIYNSNVNIVSSQYNNLITNNTSNVILNGYNYRYMSGLLNQNNMIYNSFDNNPIANVISIAVGLSHTVVLTSSRLAFSCGNNNVGQLGTNDFIRKYKLTQMTGNNNANTNITSIACGAYHTILLSTDNITFFNIYGCGLNASGQLGINNTENQNQLIRLTLTFTLPNIVINNITYVDTISTISCGANHTAFLSRISGNVYTFGDNSLGQLGIGNQINNRIVAPTQITSLPIYADANNGTGITKVVCGKNHTILLNIYGTVLTTGANNNNQLGYITTTNIFTPQPITFHQNVLDIYSTHFLDKTYLRVNI